MSQANVAVAKASISEVKSTVHILKHPYLSGADAGHQYLLH